MKNVSLTTCLLLLISSSLYAVNNTVLSDSCKSRSFWNPITIYNDSDYAINYHLYPIAPIGVGGRYVAKGMTDVFHSGFPHEKIYICISTTFGCDIKKGPCQDFARHCGTEFYYSERISAIHVKSYKDFTVTCVDGGTDSCLAKF